MRLSRKKAIELCIELWEWCALTGKNKEAWPKWKKYGNDIANECWFCEYAYQRRDKHSNNSLCGFCPYYKIYGYCDGFEEKPKGKYYHFWVKARFPRTRKKYAKLFLGQIRTLKK